MVEKIKSVVGTDGLVAVNTSGDLASSGDAIREYRYSGSAKYCTYTLEGTTYNLAVEEDTCPNACTFESYIYREPEHSDCSIVPNQATPIDGEVDNYIWFNNEMWRIIGVFKETKSDGTEEELVKIIREVPLTNAEVPGRYTYNGTEMFMKDVNDYEYARMIWNPSRYFDQTNYNDWTKAAIQYYLNDETTGASSYYNSIDAAYQSMIESVQYDISNVDYRKTASETYTAERSGNVHTDNVATWTGKIGIMYPSDYAYAASSGAWGLTTNQYGDRNYPTTLSNWMNDNLRGYVCTMSPSSYSSSSAMIVRVYGSLTDDGVNDETYVVTPVLYLKSSVVITGGTGDEDTPYLVG